MRQSAFRVDVPDGKYDVAITVGSPTSSFDGITVSAGGKRDQFNTNQGQIVTRVLQGVVADDQYLELAFNQRSDSGSGFPILGIDIMPVLNDDHSDGPEAATQLTKSFGAVAYQADGTIGTAGDVDWYWFDGVAGRTYEISAASTEISDTIVSVHDSEGNQLDWNDDTGVVIQDLAGRIEAWKAPSTGRFHVAVDGYGTSIGHYSLEILDLDALECVDNCVSISGTYEDLNGVTARVVISQSDGATPINPSLETFVIAHGFLSDASQQWMSDMASAIKQYEGVDQVLLVDWSLAIEGRIEDAGRRIAQLMDEYGLKSNQLNLIGHSFGSYVVEEIASTLRGLQGTPVNSLVALDPAINSVESDFNPNDPGRISFRDNAKFSWAIYADATGDVITLGNNSTPRTADEAFVFLSTGHNEAHERFTSILNLNRVHPNPNQYLHFNRLIGRTPQTSPWYLNSHNHDGDATFASETSHYEAVIDFADNVPTTLRFAPRETGRSTEVLFWNDEPGDQALSGQVNDEGILYTFEFANLNSVADEIDPNITTWVVVHGRNGNSDEQIYQDIGLAISATFPDHQVLTLDW
ncbi:MAG: hypothetical protein WBD31_06355, partial [Rubripirellula sp.]